MQHPRIQICTSPQHSLFRVAPPWSRSPSVSSSHTNWLLLFYLLPLHTKSFSILCAHKCLAIAAMMLLSAKIARFDATSNGWSAQQVYGRQDELKVVIALSWLVYKALWFFFNPQCCHQRSNRLLIGTSIVLWLLTQLPRLLWRIRLLNAIMLLLLLLVTLLLLLSIICSTFAWSSLKFM